MTPKGPVQTATMIVSTILIPSALRRETQLLRRERPGHTSTNINVLSPTYATHSIVKESCGIWKEKASWRGLPPSRHHYVHRKGRPILGGPCVPIYQCRRRGLPRREAHQGLREPRIQLAKVPLNLFGLSPSQPRARRPISTDCQAL